MFFPKLRDMIIYIFLCFGSLIKLYGQKTCLEWIEKVLFVVQIYSSDINRVIFLTPFTLLKKDTVKKQMTGC